MSIEAFWRRVCGCLRLRWLEACRVCGCQILVGCRRVARALQLLELVGCVRQRLVGVCDEGL